MQKTGSLDNLVALRNGLAALAALMRKRRSLQVESSEEKDSAKSLVQDYFRIVRPEIKVLGIEISDLDKEFQELLEFTNKNSLRKNYLAGIKRINALFSKAEVQREYYLGDSTISASSLLTPLEGQIAQTLEKMIPAIAMSYRQICLDLADPKRISLRGTAGELREVVRETLDHLAPDQLVMKSAGFKLEKGLNKPTMRQKSYFILKSRGLSQKEIKIAEKTTETVENTYEVISTLARSVYDSGSDVAHTDKGLIPKNTMQLKMYADAILADLLEIHSHH